MFAINLLILILSALPVQSNLYHKNGKMAWNGYSAYFDTGNIAWNGSYAYFDNGKIAFNGSYVYFSNGKIAWNGSYAYFENGNIAWNGSYIYHENGKIACNGSSAYFDNGTQALTNLISTYDPKLLTSFETNELVLSPNVALLIKVSGKKMYFAGFRNNLSKRNKFQFDRETKKAESRIELGTDIKAQIMQPKASIFVLGVKVV